MACRHDRQDTNRSAVGGTLSSLPRHINPSCRPISIAWRHNASVCRGILKVSTNNIRQGGGDRAPGALGRLLCGVAVAALATPVLAQTVPSADATVEEIVVTANKREERLREVPASVTAVAGETLTEIGAVRMEDYVALIPGLTLSNVSFSNGSNQLAIRGITTGTGANPTVGIYIDDSPFGGSTGFGGYQIPDLDPSDLQRIEVLRGPQGTLYGAGSMGGLLKFVTAKPDTSGAFGRLEVGGSSVDGGDSSYLVRGAVNLPLGDRAALRFSAYDRTDPGFVDNVATGAADVNGSHFSGARLAGLFKLNDRWTVRGSALVQRDTADGSAIVDYSATTFQPLYGDLKQWRTPRTGENEQQFEAYDLHIEGDLGWASFTSATSVNQQDIDLSLDVTSGFGPLILANFGVADAGAVIITHRELEKWTQEFRLASPDSDAKVSWLAGVFFTHEEQYLHQSIEALSALTGDPLIPALPELLDAVVISEFEEQAIFGNLTYRFTDRFDVTVGLRHSQNEQKTRQTNSGLLIGVGDTPGASDDSSTTYMVTPRLRLSEETMIYGRVASGYRPGGPNLAVPGVPTSYGPDEVVNYEAGVKTLILDRTLSLEAAVFYIDWKDIQLNERNPMGLNYFGNGGAASSKGFELSASWRPAPGLVIAGNLTHTVAELDSALPPGSVSAPKGAPLPTTPEWTGALSADYNFAIFGEWDGMLGVSYRYVGDALGYFSAPGTSRFPLEAYDVVDFRGGLKHGRWSLTAYAKNVADSRGQSAAYLLAGEQRVSVIQPRTFGISLAATF
jgi:iron complex outermembrane receptor protein